MAEKVNNGTTVGKALVVTLLISDPWKDECARLVSLNLDDEDDWGDVEVGKHRNGRCWAHVSIDEGHRWRVERAFEEVSLGTEMHQGKYPMAKELTLRELHDRVMERMDRFCS